MLLSLVRRFWNAIKPPPATARRWKPTPRQKRMLVLLGAAVAAIGLAGGAWAYMAYAPERAQAQFDQGSHLMKPGSYEEAVKRFDRSIETWPHLAQAYYERGLAHKLLGDSNAAVDDFDHAIAENPKFGAAYTERGGILKARGDLEHALADFTRAVEAEPSANGFYQRGQTYASLGQPQKAVEDFDRAIAEVRDAPYMYRARAAVRRSLGDLEGAKADQDMSLENEYRGGQPAWVDRPLPADLPPDPPPQPAAKPAPRKNKKK